MLHPVKAESVPPQPEVKTIKVELYLRFENNNSFVRGKERSREEIERRVLSRYGMQKQGKDSWTYLLTIPYTTEEELESIINGIFQEAEHIADLRNGFTEGDMQEIGGQERSWQGSKRRLARRELAW